MNCRRSIQDPHWCETHSATFSEERALCFALIYGAVPPTPYVDPLGPEGVYGFGRCDRCGESFQEKDEQAEVAGTKDDPAASILDNLTIHASCITDSDVLA